MAKSQVKIQQTAGRDALGEFAPEFAHLNDDILFGGSMEPQRLAFAPRPFHRHGGIPHVSGADRFLFQVPSRIGQKERGDPDRDGRNPHPCRILRRMAKAWAAFRMAKEVWDGNAESVAAGSVEAYAQTIFFPVGQPNDAYARYFTGQSYCPYPEGRCSRGQCDLRTGLPQQLAHT